MRDIYRRAARAGYASRGAKTTPELLLQAAERLLPSSVDHAGVEFRSARSV